MMGTYEIEGEEGTPPRIRSEQPECVILGSGAPCSAEEEEEEEEERGRCFECAPPNATRCRTPGAMLTLRCQQRMRQDPRQGRVSGGGGSSSRSKRRRVGEEGGRGGGASANSTISIRQDAERVWKVAVS
jgi:hypothetical protein